MNIVTDCSPLNRLRLEIGLYLWFSNLWTLQLICFAFQHFKLSVVNMMKIWWQIVNLSVYCTLNEFWFKCTKIRVKCSDNIRMNIMFKLSFDLIVSVWDNDFDWIFFVLILVSCLSRDKQSSADLSYVRMNVNIDRLDVKFKFAMIWHFSVNIVKYTDYVRFETWL